MTVYYNENDKHAAAWLRELMFEGQIPWGEVDDRSIEDVTPSDVRAFTQCHFFAGIGGWAYALRLAGWPDDRPVWTGSCPCQPFSAAGKGAGFADERHLWPSWHWLISQSDVPVVFGEQVARKAGREWLDLVFTDLEGIGYTCAAADLPAASAGAPHKRERNYWVAYADGERLEVGCQQNRDPVGSKQQAPCRHDAGGRGPNDRSAHAAGQRLEVLRVQQAWGQLQTAERSSAVELIDGSWRPVEPGTFPLAHGVPGRVGLIRGYGNAIVPQVGAAYIGAYLDVC